MKTKALYASFSILLIYSACDSKISGDSEKKPETKNSIIEIAGLDSTSPRNKIHKVLDDQAIAWNNGNIDQFMKGYWHSDSLKFITKNGIRSGYDSVAYNYKKHYNNRDKMGKLTFKNLSFSSLDNNDKVFNVNGLWKVQQKNKVDSGLFSLIFRQVESDWKIIIDHTW